MSAVAQPDGLACLIGIASWKRRRVRAMLRNAHGPAVVRDPARAVAVARERGGAIGCWATRTPPGLEQAARDADVPLWWIEDGFLRSAGLGAALVQPCSLTLDSRRPHYDPIGPSDLEELLQNTQFDAAMLARAEALIALLRSARLTKYNLAGEPLTLPQGRRIVLVPGQVETDQSVLLGNAGVTGMIDLLARVRAEEPDAFLIYKPHPDVVSGLRAGGQGERVATELADLVAPQADLTDLLDRVDAVHVLTSLTGFEALVRGRQVVVHGQPFYAGWGLTQDRAPIARRTRRRTLAELVAAALIAYPLYASARTGAPCSVEELAQELAAGGGAHTPSAMRAVMGRLAGWIGARRANSEA
jgi:capsular polysaccharide export protein